MTLHVLTDVGVVAVVMFQFFVDACVVSEPDSKPEQEDTCMDHAQTFCTRHTQQDYVYCANDGRIYHGLCAFYEAYCISHIIIIGQGENCSHSTHPETTTTPTVSQFQLNLLYSIIHGIDDRLTLSKSKGIPTKTAKLIFSKQDHVNKIYVRNKNCWAYGLDLTSISPWNSDLGNKKGGTLVSPRHVLWTRHYSIGINKTVRFVDANNNVVERRVIATDVVNRTAQDHFYGKDLVVGYLDCDVPTSISFARVMPRQMVSFHPAYSTRLPVLSTDQEEKVLVADLSNYSSSGISLKSPIKNSIRHEFYERKIGGDSGNPSFFVINNQLVLLFLFSTGGAGGGTNINHWHNEINDIMKQQGGDYQLTEARLYEFLQQNNRHNVID